MPRRKSLCPKSDAETNTPAPAPPAPPPSSPRRNPKTEADPPLLAAISALLNEYTSCCIIDTTWSTERARFAAAIDAQRAAAAEKGRAA